MSKTRAVRFTLHVVVDRGVWTPSEWRTRPQGQAPSLGKPTTANIEKHCFFVEASTQPGGVNAHMGATKILKAWVIDQQTGDKVAECTRAA